MNKIKCLNCGIVNWADAENCIKCKVHLVFDEPEKFAEDNGSQTVIYPVDKPENFSFLSSKWFLCLIIFVSMILVCKFAAKFSFDESNLTAQSSSTAEDNRVVTIANPPPEIIVTPPTLDEIMSHAEKRIVKDNTERFDRKIVDESKTIISGQSCDQKHVISSDSYTKCQKEWDDMFFKFCKPEITEMMGITDGGRYLQYDNRIFFFVKVKASGKEAIEVNYECSLKPAISGLVTTLYFEWSNQSKGHSTWRNIEEQVMSETSLKFNQEKKAKAEEKWAEERLEKNRSNQ